MQFNRHDELEGRHALLSPSYYHWLNYNDQKLEARFFTMQAARRGTDVHEFAHKAIRLNLRLSRAEQALATYVADGIKFKMTCEQPLKYSENCFGTADTISFRRRFLRIHDLKTGIVKTSIKQLMIYAALFCLEYTVDPFDIQIELRIYQRDDISVYVPTPEEIYEIMETIIDFDKQIEKLKEEHL